MHLLDALDAVKQRDWNAAEEEIDAAEKEAEQMLVAARGLGLMYPIAVYDDDYFYKLQDYKEMIAEREISAHAKRAKSTADTED